jgi:AraC family transcriptional regulator, regulatory protein of adaptative response / methylated-DNA-[protein]-cysteine methyltransferase
LEGKEKTMTETIRYAWGQSSLGEFLAAMSERGLVMMEFSDPGSPAVDALRIRYPEAEIIEDPAFMTEALERLGELIEHPGMQSDIPLDLRGSEFECRVWNALREIPAGQTASYGDIAQRLGAPKEAREVAEACAANTLAVVVPCHRVVKKSGAIAGYRWEFKRKRALLERERSAEFQLA